MLRILLAFALSTSCLHASGVQPLRALPYGAVAYAVQVDASGDLYAAGYYGSGHAFVARLTPDASQVIWFAEFAGSATEAATTLALDATGFVYAAGLTQSTDFPATPGASQPTGPAGSAFAVKIDFNGNVVYATYLPVNNCQAIATDNAGRLLVTGLLPFGHAFSATPGTVTGAPFPSTNISESSYILRVDPTGSKTDLAILGFGGFQIAVDAAGYIYAAGGFEGQVAPTTPGAFQSSVTVNVCAASQIMFGVPCQYQHIAKIDPTGMQLIYATYLDGSFGAVPSGIAVDSACNVIVAGTTSSPDYPTSPGAYQPEYSANPAVQYLPPATLEAPSGSGYITKLNATGTGVLWSTYFSGLGAGVTSMAIDASGNIVIAGFAFSPDLPGLWNTPVAERPPAVMKFLVAGLVVAGG